MPTFVLLIKAACEGVASIALPDGATFCISIKESTEATERDDVRVSAAVVADIPGSRGTANFCIKWERDAKHAAHLTLLKMAEIRKKYPKLEAGGWTGLVGFECRGLEPTKYRPEGEFIVASSAGTRYEDVDMSEGEWSEWDEKSNSSVQILSLESKFGLQR